jgi:type II secretory pathway component PulJ
MTLMEVLVAGLIMLIAVGSLATLVAVAVRSKLIVAVRSADTETGRQALEWMSERLRNAGLNILTSAQPPRCQDMVVAQDAALRPAVDRLYVAGEIFNTNTTAGDEVIVLGYRLTDGRIVEEQGACSGTWAPVASTVSNPGIAVTSLSFRYFERNGAEVSVPTPDVDAIRRIRMIEVAVTVQGEQGSSGRQTQTFQRLLMLRNPRPDTSNWLSPRETTEP